MADICDSLGIEAVYRFVEDKDLGTSHQRVGDPETLFHPEREVLEFAVHLIEIDKLQDPVHFIFVLDALLISVVFQIFPGGQIRKEVSADKKADVLSRFTELFIVRADLNVSVPNYN